MKSAKKRWIGVHFLSFMVLVWLTNWAALAKAFDEGAIKGPPEAPQSQISPSSGTVSGGDEDREIDLVVSKVVMERGEYSHDRTVKVTPYIRNMCNGTIGATIKVNLPELETTVWIRDGIGPQEEKSAGSLYYCELSMCDMGPFSVVVDSDNEIRENNENNNQCSHISFQASETNKIHSCPIEGPHCRDASGPEGE